MKKEYLIPAAEIRVEEKIRQSKFIATVAHAASIKEAKEFIAKIKNEFPDATHNCWAYQAGHPFDTSKIGKSDDGEPHNTAGKPMLNLLIHFKAGEIAAVVTRYFGGVKLGTGGLVRAYSGVLKKALELLELTEKKEFSCISFSINYNNLSAVKDILRKFEAIVIKEDYKENVFFSISLNKLKINDFKNALNNAVKGEVKWLT
jgi:uncharacterized YigZ family protein